jgi:hypothetical protein
MTHERMSNHDIVFCLQGGSAFALHYIIVTPDLG